jgi:hypothetical protein
MVDLFTTKRTKNTKTDVAILSRHVDPGSRPRRGLAGVTFIFDVFPTVVPAEAQRRAGTHPPASPLPGFIHHKEHQGHQEE